MFKHFQDRMVSKNELNSAVQPLLTDFYQITMVYAYWRSSKNDHATFDLFFRKNPFKGEFTIFAGLEDCLKYIEDFHFTDSDIEYLKQIMPAETDDAFYAYLKSITMKEVTVYAIREGSLVFPRVPLLRVEGPLPVVQLLETTLLNLVNYASLVATNAARFRIAAGDDMKLFEFGLRRAQGPDGALTASKCCYIGGFEATSNVLAGKVYDIPIKGTHAHSFVSSFSGFSELKIRNLMSLKTNNLVDIASLAESYLSQLEKHQMNFLQHECNKGELAAFVAYAVAFPHDCLCLVDTYNVLKSGIPNFMAVTLALNDLGYRAQGVRIDSGDLAYLSKEARAFFDKVSKIFEIDWFDKLLIVASNDINEDILYSLKNQGHSINSFGIGTHLVTCQKQPALGCVYKLVEISGKPCVKLSEEMTKATFPGKKNAYRLYDKNDCPMLDVLTKYDEQEPQVGVPFLCRHPFIETKRAYLNASRVEPLLLPYWKDGQIVRENMSSIHETRERVKIQMKNLRSDHKRVLNPTPYKISVSKNLYEFIHRLWLEYTPIGELK